MRTLDLDFQASGTRRAAWALAAAAVAFAGYAAFLYGDLRKEVAAKEARLAARPGAAISARRQDPEELAFARETILRMTVPWDALFRALEASRTDGVALLSIEPNGESRALRITGEAKSYLAALTYVANLGEQDALQRVHLARHEARGAAPGGPVSFAVSAGWKDAP